MPPLFKVVNAVANAVNSLIPRVPHSSAKPHYVLFVIRLADRMVGVERFVRSIKEECLTE